ncbi:hypothetical protein FGK63_20450 [Ruegeria sediminis]|uniref:Calcium-binding protein n=1 Tax=Ruegeria sediminis TaxID=2583820 RepID=A0ABY2WT12_9RHOB|nr:hypothetical protein [Ruegeria sediminis]TMV02601.1 hypothetical protein FGK63_20450 [Ruegeria sediminis]
MALPTPSEIMLQYLYGTAAKPEDLLNPNLVRDEAARSTMELDAVEFMSAGAGRFANLSQAQVVQNFFQAFSIGINDGTKREYTLARMQEIVGGDVAAGGGEKFGFQQYNYVDETSDYVERVFYYNSSSFKIPSEIIFVIDESGNRYIKNAKILPFDDNFDFNSDDVVAYVTNAYSQLRTDPSGIGRRVDLKMVGKENISYEGSVVGSDGETIYTRQDYISDLNQNNSNYTSVLSLIGAGINNHIDDLYQSGVTAFVQDGKALVFASADGSEVVVDDEINSYHREVASSNGIIFVGSEEADTAKSLTYRTEFRGFGGNDHFKAPESADSDDILRGDGGNDTLEGGLGDDWIEGGEGADILRGGAGDDTIVFDSEDTEIDGGDGRDVAVFEGEGSANLDLDASKVEVAIGGDSADEFFMVSGHMAAGGEGSDTFYTNDTTDTGPAIVWGGEGEDHFYTEDGRILAVQVEGLTAENFADFNLDLLGMGSDFDWSAFDLIVLNPDASDKFYNAGRNIAVRSGVYTLQEYEFDVDDINEEDIPEIPIKDFGSQSLLMDFTRAEGWTGPIGSITDSSVSVKAAGQFEVSFLGSKITHVQSSVSFGSYTGYYLYDENGNLQGADGADLSSAVLNDGYTLKVTADLSPIDAEIYFWMYFDDYQSIDQHPGFSDANQMGWFVAGGEFDDTGLVLDGTISVTMPNKEAANAITGHSDLAFKPGDGAKKLSGFQPSTMVITVAGTAVNPNTQQAGITISQQVSDVVIEYGAGDSVTLIDTSLADWLDASSTQHLGTSADDVLVGSAGNELMAGADGNDDLQGQDGDDILSGGHGNDSISAGSGDDTIIYQSGNDVIQGQHNRGHDTLDLSKYSSDQVSFSNSGADVLIDTPDGQIKLRYQHYYAIGDDRTNIETVLFSDGSLDEIGIRDRALADQSSDGDDTVTGTQFDDVISSGLGNDSIFAGSGDDTIIYQSGNDVIQGHHHNRGNDTLDLSKYSSDLVSFSHSGSHVFVNTPDGQIKLTYQNYYDFGADRTNIETILFSDGSLDEIGIRGRSINDSSTNGDDVVVGTNFDDHLDGGAGNDTLTGAGGADEFRFKDNFGIDTITDFSDGTDLIRVDIAGLGFEDLVLSDNGGDSEVDIGTHGKIILSGVAASVLTQEDFTFA